MGKRKVQGLATVEHCVVLRNAVTEWLQELRLIPSAWEQTMRSMMLGRRSSFRPIHGVSLLRPSSSFTVAMLPYATRQHRVQTRLPSRAGHRWPRCVQALDTVEQKQHLRRCSVGNGGFWVLVVRQTHNRRGLKSCSWIKGEGGRRSEVELHACVVVQLADRWIFRSPRDPPVRSVLE